MARRIRPVDETPDGPIPSGYSQLSRRLRLSVSRDDPRYPKIVRACKEAAKLPPAERLAALQQLGREVRPLLDEDAAKYTLPAWLLEGP